MEYWQAIVLAIIEGLTEFLPISSTGHMIIASYFMGISDGEYIKMFTVAIQFGAILSVLVLYWKRFYQSIDFYFKLFVAFLPAAFFGLLLSDTIDALLESEFTVAVSLILGGFVLLFIDSFFAKNESIQGKQDISYKSALIIGLYQVVAMIPGVSRSAATILGGLSVHLNRKNAAEFSFFLAVPTMLAATLYKMLKYQLEVGFSTSNVSVLLLGNVTAFFVAMLAIKAFIGYLTKHGFFLFGIYRIVLGSVLLYILYFNY